MDFAFDFCVVVLGGGCLPPLNIPPNTRLKNEETPNWYEDDAEDVVDAMDCSEP